MFCLSINLERGRSVFLDLGEECGSGAFIRCRKRQLNLSPEEERATMTRRRCRVWWGDGRGGGMAIPASVLACGCGDGYGFTDSSDRVDDVYVPVLVQHRPALYGR